MARLKQTQLVFKQPRQQPRPLTTTKSRLKETREFIGDARAKAIAAQVEAQRVFKQTMLSEYLTILQSCFFMPYPDRGPWSTTTNLDEYAEGMLSTLAKIIDDARGCYEYQHGLIVKSEKTEYADGDKSDPREYERGRITAESETVMMQLNAAKKAVAALAGSIIKAASATQPPRVMRDSQDRLLAGVQVDDIPISPAFVQSLDVTEAAGPNVVETAEADKDEVPTRVAPTHSTAGPHANPRTPSAPPSVARSCLSAASAESNKRKKSQKQSNGAADPSSSAPVGDSSAASHHCMPPPLLPEWTWDAQPDANCAVFRPSSLPDSSSGLQTSSPFQPSEARPSSPNKRPRHRVNDGTASPSGLAPLAQPSSDTHQHKEQPHGSLPTTCGASTDPLRSTQPPEVGQATPVRSEKPIPALPPAPSPPVNQPPAASSSSSPSDRFYSWPSSPPDPDWVPSLGGTAPGTGSSAKQRAPQTTKQTPNQTTKQSAKPSPKPFAKQATKQTTKRPTKQATKRATEQPTGDSSKGSGSRRRANNIRFGFKKEFTPFPGWQWESDEDEEKKAAKAAELERRQAEAEARIAAELESVRAQGKLLPTRISRRARKLEASPAVELPLPDLSLCRTTSVNTASASSSPASHLPKNKRVKTG